MWNHSKQQASIEHALLREGIRTVRVNPKNTSQECHKCDTKIVHNIKKRTVYCVNCKTVLDRDFNAAMKVAKKRYPIMNRVNGDNPSVKTQVVANSPNSDTAELKPAVISFIT